MTALEFAIWLAVLCVAVALMAQEPDQEDEYALCVSWGL